MAALLAKPYVPGKARGVLHRGYEPGSTDSILLLDQRELTQLAWRPAGILVVDGAPFSHAMIRLLTLGIPTVLISSEVADCLVEGEEILIDGLNGTVVKQPGAEQEAASHPVSAAADDSIKLTDGSQALLRASLFHTADAELAVKSGASAIGLVRTEFILPEDGHQPDAVFYENALGGLCDIAQPLPVTLRLPDIAPDKQMPWLNMPADTCRPLAMQGVRLYHEETVRDMVMSLLFAVNRLAAEYEINLLVPYVSDINEFSHWRGVIEQQLDASIPIGAMIESPAAVLAMPHWFDIADFVAIGCNDLMQCLFAADRDLPEVSQYLDPYSPELFRFLQQASVAAGDNIDKVQLCGLLPQLTGVLPVLLGMGFRVFSIAPVMVPYLAKVVRETDMAQAKNIASQVCEARDSAQVKSLLLSSTPET